jgi:beta-lactamase regulating signal transducer with metallopeptidase domain
MKNIFFKITIFSIILLALLTVNSFAISNIIEGAENFVSGANSSTISTANLKTVSETIYNILLAIGVVTSVIIASVLGIKFMTGGIAEQAKVKESLIPFVAGCVVIFGAFGIWKIIITIGQGI